MMGSDDEEMPAGSAPYTAMEEMTEEERDRRVVEHVIEQSCLEYAMGCNDTRLLGKKHRADSVEEGPQRKKGRMADPTKAAVAEAVLRAREERCHLMRNLPQSRPKDCNCPEGEECGIFYDHLGHGATLEDIRASLEKKTGWQGREIRFEELLSAKKSGVNRFGCPIAKWVVKRSGEEEKLLVLIKHRPKHVCDQAFIVSALVIWNGLPEKDCSDCYNLLCDRLPGKANPDKRMCAQNLDKSCCCQGVDGPAKDGSSFTFGCTFHRFFGVCRFGCGTSEKKKFRLMDKKKEDQDVVVAVSSLVSAAAKYVELLTPVAFHNMTRFNDEARDCRLSCDDPESMGKSGGVLPFSGTTVCMDYATHPHNDRKNMHGGVTAVLSLAAPPADPEAGAEESENNAEDQQLHVLVGYKLSEDLAPSAGVKKLDKFFTRSCILTEAEDIADSAGVDKPKKKRRDGNKARNRRLAAKEGLVPSAVAQLFDKDRRQYEVFESENLDQFNDLNVGGVALSLPPGSILLEAAKYETHATTALLSPNSRNPRRISIIGFQHHSLNHADHGSGVVLKNGVTARMKKRAAGV